MFVLFTCVIDDTLLIDVEKYSYYMHTVQGSRKPSRTEMLQVIHFSQVMPVDMLMTLENADYYDSMFLSRT
jgi:hypothetical protein